MSQGYDWTYHFADFGHTQKQALSVPAAHARRQQRDGRQDPGASPGSSPAGRSTSRARGRRSTMLDTYHGTAAGVFTGDEHYAGKDPIQGTELCAVVEYMFSLENLIADPRRSGFGDRLEKIAYNALPGTSRPTCGRTNTTSRPTRSSAPSTSATGPTTATTPTSSAWSPTTAAAPPTCTRAGRSSPPTSGWRPPTTAWPPSPTARAR